MKILIFALSSMFAITCSQPGLGGHGYSVTDRGGGTTGGTGTFRGLSMSYGYPVINQSGDLGYYVTSFADRVNQSTQQTLIDRHPPLEIRVDGLNPPGGSAYCFSNETYTGGPSCARPTTDVVNHIKSFQANPTGLQPVFINAIQLTFSHKAHIANSGDDLFSEAIFQGAYVEKAPILFDMNTGALVQPQESQLMKLSYGSGCNLDSDLNAVGFSASTSGQEMYLTGLDVFERTKRKAFAESIEVRVPHICAGSSGGYMCNVFSTKTSVWYAGIFPVLYSGQRIGMRQYPAQIPNPVTGVIEGVAGAAMSTFGLYPNATAGASYVSTPVIGAYTNAGVAVPNWTKYYIRKLCIKGIRHERDVGNLISDRPLINALRAELRSPNVRKVY